MKVMAEELPAVEGAAGEEVAGEEVAGEGEEAAGRTEEPAGEEPMTAETSMATHREDKDIVKVRDASDLFCLVLGLAMSILSRMEENAPFYTPKDTPDTDRGSQGFEYPPGDSIDKPD